MLMVCSLFLSFTKDLLCRWIIIHHASSKVCLVVDIVDTVDDVKDLLTFCFVHRLGSIAFAKMMVMVLVAV